jgi:hypothetical protein
LHVRFNPTGPLKLRLRRRSLPHFHTSRRSFDPPRSEANW